MKKLFVFSLFTLTFLFPCVNGFSDILKDLKNFEESLSDWVVQTNELNKRLSELEGERESREKQVADYNQGVADIGNLIVDLDAKVDKVSKMSSLKGVKDIVKSFEGTLDVFKQRFSEMAKRLEDQEVKTAVLERIYKTTQKPVETLISSIDEQKSVINKLTEKIAKQEKLILSMEESLKKQTSPAASSAKDIEALNARLSKLESGVIVQKKELKDIQKEVSEKAESGKEAVVSEAPTKKAEAGEKIVASEAPPRKAEAGKKVVASEVKPEKVEAPVKKATEVDGYIEIGGGFFVKDIKLKLFGSSTRISGELMNKSDRGYGMIDFKVQAFDKENVYLGGHGFSVYSFKKDKTKIFEEVITGVEIKEIAMYTIYPARMQTVSDTGESTIKMFEKEVKIAKADTKKADTKEAAVEDLEELLFDEGKGAGKLEGFESVGNGFYAGKVSFNRFGSSSTVTGEVINNSKNDFFNASFVMKIFSEAYGMITSFDFSVRRIKSGETKPFEEIVAGVDPVDINRYEIAFKNSY